MKNIAEIIKGKTQDMAIGYDDLDSEQFYVKINGDVLKVVPDTHYYVTEKPSQFDVIDIASTNLWMEPMTSGQYLEAQEEHIEEDSDMFDTATPNGDGDDRSEVVYLVGDILITSRNPLMMTWSQVTDDDVKIYKIILDPAHYESKNS